MNKFKDFLYDKSDIIVALVILIIAAGLIVWRLNAIVEYPKELIKDNSHTTDTTVDLPDDSSDKDADADKDADKDADADKDVDADKDADKNTEENNTSSNASSAVWANGVLNKDVSVSVYGASATEAIGCLVNAGLLDSYSEYEQLCKDAGRDPAFVIAGVYNFKAGATKTDIALKVNRG